MKLHLRGDIQFVYDTTYRSVFDIGDSLSLTVSDTARTLAVRRLRIPKFDVASSQSLGAIASESGISLPSGNTTLPRFENLRSAPYNFSLEENIRFVSVIEGGIRLVISNNTGVRFETYALNCETRIKTSRWHYDPFEPESGTNRARFRYAA